MTIQANARGRDLAGFVAEARARVAAEVDLPAGYFVDWGGQLENLPRNRMSRYRGTIGSRATGIYSME